MFNVIFRAMFYNDGNIFSLGNTLAFVVVVLWFYDVSNKIFAFFNNEKIMKTDSMHILNR
jgi:hypothetical protein